MRRAKTRILLDPKWPLLDRNSRRYREKGQPGAESGKSRMMVGATVGRGRQGQASKREFAEGAGVVVPCQPVAAVASTQAKKKQKKTNNTNTKKKKQTPKKTKKISSGTRLTVQRARLC